MTWCGNDREPVCDAPLTVLYVYATKSTFENQLCRVMSSVPPL